MRTDQRHDSLDQRYREGEDKGKMAKLDDHKGHPVHMIACSLTGNSRGANGDALSRRRLLV
jgi:hypothetical protein